MRKSSALLVTVQPSKFCGPLLFFPRRAMCPSESVYVWVASLRHHCVQVAPLAPRRDPLLVALVKLCLIPARLDGLA